MQHAWHHPAHAAGIEAQAAIAYAGMERGFGDKVDEVVGNGARIDCPALVAAAEPMLIEVHRLIHCEQLAKKALRECNVRRQRGAGHGHRDML